MHRQIICCLHALFVLAAANAAYAEPMLEARVTPKLIDLNAVTASAAHRRLLKRAISASAPNREVNLEFVDAAGLPTGWTLVSELAVRIAALLENGEVIVSDGSINIDGTSPRDGDILRLVKRLEAVRLPSTSISSRVAGVSARREPYDVLCRRQFLGLTRDNRVEFVNSGATLRGTALPVLQRLAELMSDCPGLSVTVTGHTDSLGDDTVNQALSQARARAVVEYLAGLGLNDKRLTALGAGDADPLVPEDRPGSRSINRRVEFSLSEP